MKREKESKNIKRDRMPGNITMTTKKVQIERQKGSLRGYKTREGRQIERKKEQKKVKTVREKEEEKKKNERDRQMTDRQRERGRDEERQ